MTHEELYQYFQNEFKWGKILVIGGALLTLTGVGAIIGFPAIIYGFYRLWNTTTSKTELRSRGIIH